MGLGWSVVFEQPVAGVEVPPPAKAVIHAQHSLRRLADAVGVTPLHQFLTTDPEQIHAFLAQEGINASDYEFPAIQWFDSSEGLRSVRVLLEALARQPAEVDRAEKVRDELRNMERVLAAADQAGIRFHLATTLPEATS